MHTAAALTTLALLTSTALAQTPSLTVFLPTGDATGAFVGDVARASGRLLGGGGGTAGGEFTWSPAEGLRPYDNLVAAGISSDGRSFAGRNGSFPGVDRDGVVTTIGFPAGRTFDTAGGDWWVGDNGSYVIFNFQTGVDRKPYKWTQATGWQLLPSPGFTATRVMDVTADGTAMVGQAQSFTEYQGYIYRQGQGITLLGSEVFPTAINEAGNAYLANRIIPQTVFFTAELTLDGATTNLGLLPGFVSSYATDLSANANTVVGLLQPNTLSSTAFIWTPQQGMRTITDFAASYGIAFPAHTQIQGLKITADGSMIAGSWTNGSGFRGFALTIPSPGPTVFLGVSALAVARRRRY